jgi:hypothetical protein
MPGAGTDGKGLRPTESTRFCTRGMEACEETWTPMGDWWACMGQGTWASQESKNPNFFVRTSGGLNGRNGGYGQQP